MSQQHRTAPSQNADLVAFYVNIRTNLRLERSRIASRLICGAEAERPLLREAELLINQALTALGEAEIAAHAERLAAA